MDFGSQAHGAQGPGQDPVSSGPNSVERSQSDGLLSVAVNDQLPSESRNVEPRQAARASTVTPFTYFWDTELSDDEGESCAPVESRLSQLPNLLAQQSLDDDSDEDESDETDSDIILEDVPMGQLATLKGETSVQEPNGNIQDGNSKEPEVGNVPDTSLPDKLPQQSEEHKSKEPNMNPSEGVQDGNKGAATAQEESTHKKQPVPFEEVNETDSVPCDKIHIGNEGGVGAEAATVHAPEEQQSAGVEETQCNEYKAVPEETQLTVAEKDQGNESLTHPREEVGKAHIDDTQGGLEAETAMVDAPEEQLSAGVEEDQVTQSKAIPEEQQLTISEEIQGNEVVEEHGNRVQHEERQTVTVIEDSPQGQQPTLVGKGNSDESGSTLSHQFWAQSIEVREAEAAVVDARQDHQTVPLGKGQADEIDPTPTNEMQSENRDGGEFEPVNADALPKEQIAQVTEGEDSDPNPTSPNAAQPENRNNEGSQTVLPDATQEQQRTRVTDDEGLSLQPAEEKTANEDTDVVMKDVVPNEEPQQPCLQEAADREIMQPLIDTEPSSASRLPANNDRQSETMQPSIDCTKEVIQPSIGPDSLPRAKVDAKGKVRTWLRNNESGPSDPDQDQAVGAAAAQDNGDGFLNMSQEDLHELQDYLARHARDTPDADDDSMAAGAEAAEGWVANAAQNPSPTVTPPPSPRIRIPRNRPHGRERERTGGRRLGSGTRKRKRGNSRAGRRSKVRSMSRDVEEADQASVIIMELPQRKEFELSTYQRLGPNNFKWGPKPTLPALDTSNLRNLGVQIVDPLYDGDERPEKFRSTGGQIVSKPIRVREPTPAKTPEPPRRRTRKARTRTRRLTPPMEVEEDKDVAMAEPEEEVEEGPETSREKTPVKEPVSLGDLPDETLGKIFRELLISHAQIYVYEEFTKVYPASRRRSRLNIETAVLLVCKRTYHVGITVLYGENTFVYSLRDAPGQTAPRPVDVEKLAQDDSSTQAGGEDSEDYDDDDASEYVDDGNEDNEDDHVIGRRHRRQKYKGWDGDIRIAKYFSLFRQIVIEAEHNRYGTETMARMSDAIDFWNKPQIYTPDKASLFPNEQPVAQPKPKKRRKGRAPKPADIKSQIPQEANLHTLALRIFPMYKETSPGGYYTFVSFFEANSPVIASLKTTLPQYTRLEMIWKYMHVLARPSCLLVNMRPLRIKHNVAQGGRDIWRRDKLMLGARKEGVSKAISALDRLGCHVQMHCEKQHGIQRTEGGYVPDNGEDEEWLEDGINDEPGEFVE